MRSDIRHFPLPGILPPNHVLAVHPELLCQLAPGRNGPRLIRVVQLGEKEIKALLALLSAYPTFCPYEVLLASCTGEKLDDLTLSRYRRLLEEKRLETLAPAIDILRSAKENRGIRALNITIISILDRGYLLAPITRRKPRLLRAQDESLDEKRLPIKGGHDKNRQKPGHLHLVRK